MTTLRLIWRDATLRMIAVATALFGVFAASFEPYLSLIGISVFGLNDQAYAAVLAVSMVISVAAALGVGIMTDRFACRKALALAAVVSIILGTGFVWLIEHWLIFSLAHMIILPLAGSLMGQLFAITKLYATKLHPGERDGITSTVRAFFALPFAIVLPIWGMAFDAGASLLAIYPAILLVGILFFWLVWTYWPADNVAPWEEEKSHLSLFAAFGEILASSVVWRIFAMGAVHAGSTLMAILLALVFDAANGRSAGDVGLFFGGFVALEIVTMLSVGTVVRYLRRLHIIAVGGGLYALFMVLLPICAPTPFVWALIVPVAVGGGLIYGLSISYLQDLLGNRAGTGSALVAVQRLVSQGLAAAVFAIGVTLSGYPLAAFLGAGVIVAGVAALFWLDRPQ